MNAVHSRRLVVALASRAARRPAPQCPARLRPHHARASRALARRGPHARVRVARIVFDVPRARARDAKRREPSRQDAQAQTRHDQRRRRRVHPPQETRQGHRRRALTSARAVPDVRAAVLPMRGPRAGASARAAGERLLRERTGV